MIPSQPSEFDESFLKDITVSRDFRLAHPELVKRVKDLFEAYKRMFPSRDVIATCTYRSPAEQGRLYKQGRFGSSAPIVTQLDGVNNKSNHNCFPARAVDCAILEGGKCIWEPEIVFYPFGKLAHEVGGLVWGGDWATFKDWPHIELSKEIK